MINLSLVTKALQEQLNNDPNVRDIIGIDKEVVRGEMINMDVNQAPWIGIYRGDVKYEPRTLGSMNNWEAFPTVKIIVQASDLRSAENCEDNLESYVKTIIDAIISDTTINGTVDMINSYSIEAGYIETERSNIHFQGASITLDMEVATQ